MDPIKILDTLRSATQDIERLKEEPPPEIPKEQIHGLRFRRGQRVKDKVTGMEGEVIDGGTAVFQI